MRFSEFATKPSKPLTPEKARIKALKHQKDNATKAVKLNELLNLPKPNQQQQQRPLVVQPAAVTQQQKVDQLVAKIAASDALRAPTEEEKVLAMWKYMDIKQQAEDNLKAQQQRQKPQQMPLSKPKQR